MSAPLSRFSGPTRERLSIYHALLEKWNPAINLVSRKTLENAWSRHFADSAQLAELAPRLENKGALWADLGSGGGFPGMVCAIICAETRPDMQFTLVEADSRKAAFLRTVSRETQVNVRVLVSRIEDTPPLSADILTARALAPLTGLLSHASRHLALNGICLFPKGETWQKEHRDALERFRFHSKTHISRIDPASVILEVRDIADG